MADKARQVYHPRTWEAKAGEPEAWMQLLTDLWSSLGYYRNGLTWKAIRGREERKKGGKTKERKRGRKRHKEKPKKCII